MFTNGNQPATGLEDTEELAASRVQVLRMVKNGAREREVELAVVEGQMFRELLSYGNRQLALFCERPNRTCAYETTAVGFQSGHSKSFPCQRVTRNSSAGPHVEGFSAGRTEEFPDLVPFAAFPIALSCRGQRVVIVRIQNQFLLFGLRPQPRDCVFPCRRSIAHMASRSEALSSRMGCAGFPATMVYSGTFLVTTAPAPTMPPVPMVTPRRIIAWAPIHASGPMVIACSPRSMSFG